MCAAEDAVDVHTAPVSAPCQNRRGVGTRLRGDNDAVAVDGFRERPSPGRKSFDKRSRGLLALLPRDLVRRRGFVSHVLDVETPRTRSQVESRSRGVSEVQRLPARVERGVRPGLRERATARPGLRGDRDERPGLGERPGLRGVNMEKLDPTVEVRTRSRLGRAFATLRRPVMGASLPVVMGCM